MKKKKNHLEGWMKKEERKCSRETLAQWTILSVQMPPILRKKSGSCCFLNSAVLCYNVYLELDIFSQNKTQSFTSTNFIVILKLKKTLNHVKKEKLGF